MDRNHHGLLKHILIAVLLIASLGALSSCGGGGGGGSTPPGPVYKSGDVVWAQTVDPTVSQPDEIYGVAVDGTAVYAVGYDSNTIPNSDDQWRIEKRGLDNGTLISSFGSSGVIATNPSSTNIYSYDDANGIAIDSQYMYVVGYDTSLDPNPGSATASNDEQWRIEKRSLSTGALSYVVTSNTSSFSDQANAIAIDAARAFMYVAGYDSSLSGGFQQWRIEKRNLSSGSVVTAFGPSSDGVIVSAPSATSDAKATSIAIESDNTYMYVGGYQDSAQAWRIEKRSLATGETVTAFGPANDGVVTVPSTSAGGQAIVSAVKVDGQYLYVGGYDTLGPNNRVWRLEKRDKTTGQLIAAFNSNGVVISDPNPAGLDVLKALEIDANYVYAAGYDTAAADGKKAWRIEKRNKSDGALVAAFATNGVYRNHPSAAFVRDDDIWAIAVDAGYLYVVGYDMVPGTRQWRIEKIVK